MAAQFSYAQAAKGQPSATQSTENVKDSANGEQPNAEPNAVKTANAEEETSRNTTLKAQLVTKQDTASAPAEVNNTTSTAASVADSRRDDEDAATESSTRRSDKSVRSASASTRVTDEAEPKKGSRKPRKGKAGKESSEESKKDKAAEQEKELPKVELVEAPLPSVNIWTQRKETQAAKTTITLPAQPASSRSDSGAAPADTWPNSQESKKKSKTTESSDAANGTVNGTKAQRKVDDAATRRNGARGSRLIERDNRVTELPPPVNDVTSWPTPETAVKEAVKEERRKPAEKAERPEAEDESGSKGRSKDKWERIDFVPSVQFSTPIPSTRGARGGRGGARGGRESTSRGGHGAAGAAADKSATAPSKTGGEARERARDGNASARTNSQPPAAAKRASMDVSKEQRKASTPASAERSKDSQSNATNEQAGPVRGEGRGDRGRGNFRGRGGHPGNVSMHAQQSSYMSNGNSFSSQGPPRQYASPPLHQGNNFAPSYGGSQSRGGRGGRGQSNGSGPFRGVGGSNANRARQVQANMGQPSWDYQAMPVQQTAFGWYDHLRHVAIPQLEYYFSLENLLKDDYLRKHMDGQGFVPLELVLSFSRVRDLAPPDTLRMIACECAQVDYVVGDDNVDRIRSRAHWQKFVYPALEQRVEAARNAGPQYFYYRSLHSVQYPPGMMGEYPVTSPTGYTNGVENGYMPYPTDTGAAGQPNGQLSAHVPEFQPSGSAEGSASADAESKVQLNLEEEVDEARGGDAKDDSSSSSSSLSSPSQRAHLLMRSTESINDIPYPEFRINTLCKRRDALPGVGPGVLDEDIPSNTSDTACGVPGGSDMISLYRFWSHFLARHFDLEMFEEFRACAMADATGDTVNTTGLENLIAYYETILGNDKNNCPLDDVESRYEEARKLVAAIDMS
ncbi:La domain-containing protein [Colletotrichum camelliae]|nr:La domain-containing protein [Colletotrichum camelliae]